MEISAWVAVAILVLSSGDVVVANSEDAYKTKADCEKINAQASEVAKQNAEIIAFGTACAQIKVSDNPAAATAKPGIKKPSGTQKDLEKSNDPAHASEFRSTSAS